MKLVFGRAVCVVDFYEVSGDDGDYAWHLRNPRRVEPVEVKGSASLYRVPDERIRFIGREKHAAPTPAPAPTPKARRGPPPLPRKRVANAPIPVFLEPEKPRRRAPKGPACGS